MRAPNQDRAISRDRAYIDTRGPLKKLFEESRRYEYGTMVLTFMIVMMVFYPSLVFIVLPLSLYIWLSSIYDRELQKLPLKLPIGLNKTDYNHFEIANRYKFKKASGTINLGNEQVSKKECWLVGSDLLTHMLLIGTTGAGKTDALVSMTAASAFVMGGGVIYVDAKAAPKLQYQFVALARLFGREDCLRFVSYKTGNKSVRSRYWKKLSSTCNPFSQGTAGVSQQILEGVMPESGGDNQYFRDKAIAALEVLLPCLVELRDAKLINITPSLIGQMFSVPKFIMIAFPEHYNSRISFRKLGQESAESIPNILSNKALWAIRSYLTKLPSFKSEEAALINPSQQSEEVFKQFGFGEGYLVKPLAKLASTYAHIYECELAETDYADIVMNNRILVVMIPAMEQSPDQRQMQGKIQLSGIRVAMSMGLGGDAEGDVDDVLNSLPIDMRIPSMIVVDEYAECAVEGFAVTATQGRGLGIGVIFSGQDLAGFIKASEQETNMIFGNTRLKVLMSLEDVKTTWEWFVKLADKMKVAESQGWEKGENIRIYKQNLSAQIREADRINFLDVKGQIESEAHVFHGDKVLRVDLFHYGLDAEKLAKNLRQNRLLQIRAPNEEQVKRITRELEYTRAMEWAIDKNQYPSARNTFNLRNSDAGTGTEWIYTLIGECDKELAADEKRASFLGVTTKVTPQQKDLLDDSGQYNDDGVALATLDRPTIKPKPKTPLTGFVNASAQTNGEYQKVIESAQWVFGFANSDDAIDGKEIVYNNFKTIALSAGMSDADAQDKAIEQVKIISDEYRYTSEPIESKGEDDTKLLYGVVKALNKK